MTIELLWSSLERYCPMTEPATKSDLAVEIPATLLDVRKVGDWLTLLATAGRLPEAIVPQLELALVELCNNIVTHGYASVASDSDVDEPADHRIRLETEITDSDVVVTVTDKAPPYDLTTAKEPDPDHPTVHGYGIMILRQLTDQFSVESTAGGNRWHLAFRNPSLSNPGSD